MLVTWLRIEGVVAPCDPLAEDVLLTGLDLNAVRYALKAVLEHLFDNLVARGWDDRLVEDLTLEDFLILCIEDDVLIAKLEVTPVGVTLKETRPVDLDIFIWCELQSVPPIPTDEPAVATAQSQIALVEANI